MKTTIRPATQLDMSAVLNLIQELATFEIAPDEVDVSVDDLIRDGFGEHSLFHVIIAENEDGVVGMALWFYKYSTWKGKVIYLEDIVVKLDQRRKGIGKLLLKDLIRIGKEQKVKRIDWVVLDWNEMAINFYKKYNAEFDSEWMTVRLTDKHIDRILSSNEGF